MINSKNFSLYLLLIFLTFSQFNFAQSSEEAAVIVKKTSDFTLTGEGNSSNWAKTDWIQLPSLNTLKSSTELSTKAKVLYSETGLYFLFSSEDTRINATMKEDYLQLWREDVVEIFLKPITQEPFYLEYELSPLNYELLLFISDKHGYKTRWRPFDYDTPSQTRHKTTILGGPKESGASITGWLAEFFIPYTFLQPVGMVPPSPGDKWKANLYRVEYEGEQVSFAWQPVDNSFHDYANFGTFIFE